MEQNIFINPFCPVFVILLISFFSLSRLKKEESRRKNREPSPTKLMVVSADPGIDDAQAILMGLCNPKWKILAIIAHYGSTTVEITMSNSVKFLAAIHRTDVPVYRGSERPLVTSSDTVKQLLRNDKFTDPEDLSLIDDNVQSENGILAMIRLVKENPGQITLLSLGPLTDLALAHRFNSQFSKDLKSCHIMGGNYKSRGNFTKSAELNFFLDPEAAHIVVTEFACPITLFTWELCCESALPWEFRDELYRTSSFKTRVMMKLESNLLEQWKACGPYVICDELAMAGILDEYCILKWEQVSVEVELSGKLTRGQLVVDWYNRMNKPKNVRLVTKMNMKMVKEVLLQTFTESSECYV